MNLGFSLEVDILLRHKQTFEPLHLRDSIKTSYNEETEEFKNIVEKYELELDMLRSDNEELFDEKMLSKMISDLKEEIKERIDNIQDVFKKCTDDNVYGWIEFAGHILNASDFCAMQIKKFDARIFKR